LLKSLAGGSVFAVNLDKSIRIRSRHKAHAVMAFHPKKIWMIPHGRDGLSSFTYYRTSNLIIVVEVGNALPILSDQEGCCD